MPKISIIVPVYNSEKYLCKCVDSILEQSIKDIEVILINDGSVDNSGKICDKYKEKDFRVKVIHKKNEGLSIARNVGLNISTGKYIGFVDSDDWIEKDMYENLYNNCEKYKSDISIIGIKEVNEYEHSLNTYIPDIKSINFSDILQRAYACNKIFKRDLFFENNLFFKRDRCFEDLELVPKLYLRANKVTCVEKIGYFYLKRSDSITGIRDDKILDNMWAYVQLKNYLIQEEYYDEYEDEYKKGINNAKQFYSNVLYEYTVDFLINNYKIINNYFRDIGGISRVFYLRIFLKSIIYNIKLKLHNMRV